MTLGGGLLGFLVLAAVYAAVSSGVSLLVAASGPFWEKRLAGPWSRQAERLLALALAPAGLGLLATLWIALPAWVRHEPRGGPGEGPGPVLLMLASAGLTLVLVRLGGALRDQVRTRRLASRWIGSGRELNGLPLPATRVPCDFPLAAVYGVFRPRLLLSERLLDGLDASELRAVVEHEMAHARVRENLRRFLLRASPDLLAFLPTGRRLRARFDETSEVAADQAATARVEPLLLARALLKAAQLVAPGQRLELAFAAFHRAPGIAGRVAALLEDRTAGGGEPARGRAVRPRVAWVLALVGVAAAGQLVSPAVHRVLEDLVHLFS